MPCSTSTLLFIALFLAVCGSGGGGTTVNLISDIHLDPLYGTRSAYRCTATTSLAMGEKGCDSPLDLATSAFGRIAELGNTYTVYAGDWQRHDFEPKDLNSTVIFDLLSPLLLSSANCTNVEKGCHVGSLGNDDVYPNYGFDWTSDAALTRLADQATALHTSGILSLEESNTMSRCGYYSKRTDQLVMIVLHSLVWSHSIFPSVPESDDDPCGQFQFLEQELAYAEKNSKKALVVGHIPPIPNVYGIARRGEFRSEPDDMYWKSSYQSRYFSIIKRYTKVVVLQVYGHTHMFSVVAADGITSPLVTLPSISPIFGNTPSFVEAYFTPSWTLEDMRQHFYNTTSEQWGVGRSSKEVFSLFQGFSNANHVQTQVKSLLTDDTAWENYLQMRGGEGAYLAVFPSNTCDTFCRLLVVCSMTDTTYDSIKNCTLNPIKGGLEISRNSTGAKVLVFMCGCFLAAVLAGPASLVIPDKRRTDTEGPLVIDDAVEMATTQGAPTYAIDLESSLELPHRAARE